MQGYLPGNISSQHRPVPGGQQVGKPQRNAHISRFLATSCQKTHPFGGSPELGEQNARPGFLLGCSLPSCPAPRSQSLGNTKFLSPFCCLKTDTVLLKHKGLPVGLHVSAGADAPAGPASITRELEATGTVITLSPPKTRALRSPWPSCSRPCRLCPTPLSLVPGHQLQSHVSLCRASIRLQKRH